MHSGRGLLLSFDDTPRSIGRRAGRVDQVAAKADEDIDAVLSRPDGQGQLKSGADGQLLETALAPMVRLMVDPTAPSSIHGAPLYFAPSDQPSADHWGERFQELAVSVGPGDRVAGPD